MEKLLNWVGRRNKKEIFFICWIVYPVVMGILDGGLNTDHYGQTVPHAMLFLNEFMNAFIFPFVMLLLRSVVRQGKTWNPENNR